MRILQVMVILIAAGTARISNAVEGSWEKVNSPCVIGRIDEIAVGYEQNLRRIFLADSSEFGSLWMSENDGVTWYPSHSVEGHWHRRVETKVDDASKCWTLVPSNSESVVDAAAGPFWSTNGGRNWWPGDPNYYLADFKYSFAMAVDQSDGDFQTVYIGGKGLEDNDYKHIQKTTDGGESWFAADAGIADNQEAIVLDISICASSPNVVYCLYQPITGGDPGVYRSTDRCESWEFVHLISHAKIALEVDPENAERFVYSTFLIAPGGGSVSGIHLIDPIEGYRALYIDDVGGMNYCQSIAFDPSGAIYMGIYNTGVPTFTLLRWDPENPELEHLPTTGFVADKNIYSVVLDPLNSDRVLVGAEHMFYISEDRGESFTERAAQTNIVGDGRIGVNLRNMVVMSKSVAASYAFQSTDYASTWILRHLWNSENPGTSEVITGLHEDGNNTGVWYGSKNHDDQESSADWSDILKSTDDGSSWTVLETLPRDTHPIDCLAVDRSANSDYLFFGGGTPGAIFFSSDGGGTWDYRQYTTSMNVVDISISSLDPNRIIAADGNNGVSRSTDRGNSWELINDGLVASEAQEVAFCPQRAHLALVGTSIGIYKSLNVNQSIPSWTASNSGAVSEPVEALAFHHSDNSIVLACFNEDEEGRVYISADTGRSWIPIGTGLDNNIFHDISSDQDYPDTFYVTTGDGIYKLKNPVKSGTLASNQTWGPGTIIVNGDVTVPTGVTLTIAAGTNVLFVHEFDKLQSGASNNKSELIVYGGLNAPGTEQSPIVFKSGRPGGGEPGDWYGISCLAGGSVGLEYCQIRHANVGVAAFAQDNLILDHCLLEDAAFAGIQLEENGEAASIMNSTIQNCGQFGLYSKLSSLDAFCNTISGCDYGIYFIGQQNQSASIQGTIITGSGPGSYYGIYSEGYEGYYDHPAVSIHYSDISGFGQGGISIRGAGDGSSIESVSIVDCAGYGIFMEECPNVLPISGYQGWPTYLRAHAYGLWIDNGGNAYVRYTKFQYNAIYDVYLADGSEADLGRDDPEQQEWGNNAFYLTDEASYMVYSESGNSIPAQRNYWSDGEESVDCREYIYGDVDCSEQLNEDPLPDTPSPKRDAGAAHPSGMISS